MLDLFSGTGSVGQVFRKAGYDVVSLDFDRKMRPSICVDILQWDYRAAFPVGHFEVIFACPPCTEFSQALTTRVRDLAAADLVVRRTLEIINYFKPQKWFLENPRGGSSSLRTRPYMANLPFVDVDYCQFCDWGYQKPTGIWVDPIYRF